MATKAPVYVTVSALEAGHLTLPERLFVAEADPEKASTVPSLSFLIQHPGTSSDARATNLVFDLGLKRDLTGYTPTQQAHAAQRRPVGADPDCAASLRKGGHLDPATDVDVVVLSHVHWDHVGTPSDFKSALFAVGSGTLNLLRSGGGPLYPAHLFNQDELPAERTVEFPPVVRSPRSGGGSDSYDTGAHVPLHTAASARAREVLRQRLGLPASAAHDDDLWAWKPLASFPHALDLFADGSVYVIDSPGHLFGHVNLLARTGETSYVYLGGDCCHDPRILSGEKAIAMYDDGRGGMRSVHVDTAVARRTLDRVAEFVNARRVEGGEGEVRLQVVLAHDAEWASCNGHAFWPGTLEP